MSGIQSEPAVVYDYNKGPGCLVRGLWFIFIGLWLGGIWCWIAWILNITIIGMPLGLWMLNRIPQVMTLKPVRTVSTVSMVEGRPVITNRNPKTDFLPLAGAVLHPDRLVVQPSLVVLRLAGDGDHPGVGAAAGILDVRPGASYHHPAQIAGCLQPYFFVLHWY